MLHASSHTREAFAVDSAGTTDQRVAEGSCVTCVRRMTVIEDGEDEPAMNERAGREDEAVRPGRMGSVGCPRHEVLCHEVL
jgi:hypothetical protein